MKYNIIRFYRPDLNKDNKIVRTGLTLKQAQKHCNDPNTATAEYFDGYSRE